MTQSTFVGYLLNEWRSEWSNFSFLSSLFHVTNLEIFKTVSLLWPFASSGSCVVLHSWDFRIRKTLFKPSSLLFISHIFQGSFLLSLSLSFLICKMGIISLYFFKKLLQGKSLKSMWHFLAWYWHTERVQWILLAVNND